MQLNASKKCVGKRLRADSSSIEKLPIGRRRRLRSGRDQVSEQESSGVSPVECVDVQDDLDLSGGGGKKCESSCSLKSRENGKRDDLRMSVRRNCRVSDDEEDLEIICEVFNSPHAKVVKIEGDDEHEHVLEKGMDVLKFVEEKKHEVSNDSLVCDAPMSNDDNNDDDDKKKKGGDGDDNDDDGNGERKSFSDNESDNRSGNLNKERRIEIMNKSNVKNEVKKSTKDSQGVATRLRSNSAKETEMMAINIINPITPKEFDEMSFSSESDNDDNSDDNSNNSSNEHESCEEDVCKESGESQIVAKSNEHELVEVTTTKSTDKVVPLNAKNVSQILANSLLDVGEGQLENFTATHGIEPVKETSVYKFRFTDEDLEPVEKSEFEKEIDKLFAEMDMHLTSEQIGSAPLVSINTSLDHSVQVIHAFSNLNSVCLIFGYMFV